MPNKVFIMRGVPGSGKSHEARKIAADHGAVVVSADDFPGLYTKNKDGSVYLNLALLDEAHGTCLMSAVRALTQGRSVVVDNTNLSALEAAPYVALAQAFRVPCVLVRVICNPTVAFDRQTHGVPKDVHARMVERFYANEKAPHWPFIPFLALRTDDREHLVCRQDGARPAFIPSEDDES